MSRGVRALLVVGPLLVGASGATAATVDLGDVGTTQSRVVADMEALALANLGHTVNRVGYPNAPAAAEALRTGAIDAYVADSSQIVEEVYGGAKRRLDSVMRNFIADQVAADGAAAVGYSQADDSPAVACRKRTTLDKKLTALGRLPAVARSLRYGATPSHMTRADGFWALRATFRWIVVRNGPVRFTLIGKKRLDCVESSVAEPRAVRLHLVTLRDQRRRLAGTPHRAVTVAATSALGSTPDIQAVAELVGDKLTRGALARLRGWVEIDGRTTSSAAQTFLVAIGVLPTP